MLSSILMIIAGLGVFLFGIKTFSSNIEKLSSNKMRKKINQFSKNRIAAVGSGFAFTSILQSSTASIVLVAGFTTAGIISLFQGLGLALGSSMASALPNFLISISSFNIKEFFYALAGIGVLILLLAKRPVTKNIATSIVGFSLIFIGMMFMSNGTSFFATNPTFINFFHNLTNPILLILIGIVFTIISQSSLGTVAMLITLVGTSTTFGAIPIESAAYIIYGANIGSAITTMFFLSLSSNIDGKRIGVFHIIYMTFGAILFSLLSLTPWIETLFGWVAEPAFKLAFINLTFGIVSCSLMIPILKPLTKLMKKIMPDKKNKNPLAIEEVANESPSITLAKANEKTIVYFEKIIPLYERTVKYIEDDSNDKHKKLMKDLSEYNTYINNLNMYVVRIATNDAYESVTKEIENLLNVIKQVERVNRNCIKILSILKKEDKKITYPLTFQRFTKAIFENTKEMFKITTKFIKEPDCKFLEEEKPSLYSRILELSHLNSETKLSAKTFVIERGFNSKSSTEKNTSYIELMSYLGLISNNILDIVFEIMGQAGGILKPKYEQLILDEISKD